jgi:serine/threonine protein phosphatase PrpC
MHIYNSFLINPISSSLPSHQDRYTQPDRMMPPSLSVLLLLIVDVPSCLAFWSWTPQPQQPLHPSVLLHLSISSYSLAGSDPDRPGKVNQDASFHEILKDGRTFFGVMDGHGLQGHILTRFLGQAFPSILKDCLCDHYVPTAELIEYQQKLVDLGKDADQEHFSNPLCQAFHIAQVAAMQDPNVPAGRSGTTCIVGVWDSTLHRLDMAHVGDSRAIWFSHNTIVPLSQETTTKSMPLEFARVQQGQGRVDAMGNVFYGPQGIAMTRSLGNAVMLRAGILPTPILLQKLLTEGTVVLATDGVWDVLSNEQVRDIVTSATVFQDSGRLLAEVARRKWIGDLPIEGKVDDITCVIVRI